MNKRYILAALIAIMTVSFIPGAVFAHVVVTPAKLGVGQWSTFVVSVPNEKQVAVTSLKLDIPASVASVTPTTKDGWTITTAVNNQQTTSITWASGTIPVGQRQDFSFSAQAPAQATNLDWKAYQTYADGSVVHWDQLPTKSDDGPVDTGPYSVTHVVDNLTETAVQKPDNTLPIVLSAVAIVLSSASLFIRRR